MFKMFEDSGVKPYELRSDQGSEYKNSEINFLNTSKVEIYLHIMKLKQIM